MKSKNNELSSITSTIVKLIWLQYTLSGLDMNNLKSCNDHGVAATIRLVNIIREKENLP